MPTNVRDPRTIITPDAFEIDGALLGLPLARPSRRGWAMLIDFAVIGVLTAVLSDVQLLLWGVIALILVSMALRRSGRTLGQAATVMLRLAVGCLGLFILLVVLVVWGAMRLNDEERGRMVQSAVERAVTRLDPGVVRRMVDVGLADAATAAEAGDVMEDVADELEETGMSRSTLRSILLAAVPEDADWAPSADSLVDAVLAGYDPEEREGVPSEVLDDVADALAPEEPSPPGGPDETETGGAADEEPAAGVAAVAVEDLAEADLLREYASLATDAEAGTARPGASARADSVRRRALEVVAGDTLEELADELEDQRSRADELAAAAETEPPGAATAFAGLLRDVWEQLGSAIGLWSVYFTVLLTLWKGQTVGKKLMGIRVVRLDGEPINWWSAFERAGGYVAGLATGLLGFLQVYWDPNRQCIHDKIVGTVVVMAGAEAVPGAWEEAWDAENRPTPRKEAR